MTRPAQDVHDDVTVLPAAAGDALAAIVDWLLATLPGWFGMPEANAAYIASARTLPGYLAMTHGRAVGALLVARHFPESAEIHLLAVERSRHRHGIGGALIAAAERDLAADGCMLLQVKTVGASHPEELYARTRAFYAATGFIPLEETQDLWPSHPCLILVKPLRAATSSE